MNLTDSIHNPFFGTETEKLGGPGSGPHPGEEKAIPERMVTNSNVDVAKDAGYKYDSSKKRGNDTQHTFVHPNGNKVSISEKTNAWTHTPANSSKSVTDTGWRSLQGHLAAVHHGE